MRLGPNAPILQVLKLKRQPSNWLPGFFSIFAIDLF